MEYWLILEKHGKIWIYEGRCDPPPEKELIIRNMYSMVLHIYTYTCVCVFIYVYILWGREKEGEKKYKAEDKKNLERSTEKLSNYENYIVFFKEGNSLK